MRDFNAVSPILHKTDQGVVSISTNGHKDSIDPFVDTLNLR